MIKQLTRILFEKDENGRSHYRWVIFAIIAVAAIPAIRPVSRWIYTHWVFTYETEFVKRGLIGEVLQLTGIPPSYLIVTIISFLIAGLVVLMLLYVFIKPWSKENFSSDPAGLFFLMAATSSATIPHFLYNIGRFDHILYIFFFICIWFIFKQNRLAAALVFTALSAVALFIHEAYFFILLPLLIVFWFYKDPGTIGFNIARVGIIAGIVLLTWYIGTYGRIYGMEFDDKLAWLESIYGYRIVDSSVAVLFRGLPENLEFSAYWMLRPHMAFHTVFFLIVFSPMFFLCWKLTSHDYLNMFKSAESRNRSLIYLACFSPMLLTPLGFDFFRWWALSFTNLLISFVLLSQNAAYRTQLLSKISEYKYLVILVIAISLVFGMLGNSFSFQWASQIWPLYR